MVSGRATDERGLMHAKQIIERYEAPEATFYHKAIVINISRSAALLGIYQAVRHAWKLDPRKAKAAGVLAVDQGLIIGVFIAESWIPATVANFPDTTEDRPGRWGFIGREAPPEIANLYLRHRLPDYMRKRGAANPIRYADAGR